MTNNQLEKVKAGVYGLYEQKRAVHLDLAMKGERVRLENADAKIVSVYPNIFMVRERDSGKIHTLQYVDLITHNARISELEI